MLTVLLYTLIPRTHQYRARPSEPQPHYTDLMTEGAKPGRMKNPFLRRGSTLSSRGHASWGAEGCREPRPRRAEPRRIGVASPGDPQGGWAGPTWLESPVQVSAMSHSFTASRQDTPRGSYWERDAYFGGGQNRGLRARLPQAPPRPAPGPPSPVSPAPGPAHGSPPPAPGQVPRPALQRAHGRARPALPHPHWRFLRVKSRPCTCPASSGSSSPSPALYPEVPSPGPPPASSLPPRR